MFTGTELSQRVQTHRWHPTYNQPWTLQISLAYTSHTYLTMIHNIKLTLQEVVDFVCILNNNILCTLIIQ